MLETLHVRNRYSGNLRSVRRNLTLMLRKSPIAVIKGNVEPMLVEPAVYPDSRFKDSNTGACVNSKDNANRGYLDCKLVRTWNDPSASIKPDNQALDDNGEVSSGSTVISNSGIRRLR